MSETSQPCPVCPEGDAIPLVMPAMSVTSQINYVINHGGPSMQVFRSVAASFRQGREGRKTATVRWIFPTSTQKSTGIPATQITLVCNIQLGPHVLAGPIKSL